jgi:translation initiation factor 2-alpha kinase 4
LVYNEKVDIYSLGLILLELCSRFQTQSERRIVLENVRHMVYPEALGNKFPLEFALIKLLTNTNPELRPSTHDIMEQKEFNTLRDIYDFIDIND